MSGSGAEHRALTTLKVTVSAFAVKQMLACYATGFGSAHHRQESERFKLQSTFKGFYFQVGLLVSYTLNEVLATTTELKYKGLKNI